jgi:hypothetical protein
MQPDSRIHHHGRIASCNGSPLDFQTVPPYELHHQFQYFALGAGYIATVLGPDVEAVANHPDKENFFDL